MEAVLCGGVRAAARGRGGRSFQRQVKEWGWRFGPGGAWKRRGDSPSETVWLGVAGWLVCRSVGLQVGCLDGSTDGVVFFCSCFCFVFGCFLFFMTVGWLDMLIGSRVDQKKS